MNVVSYIRDLLFEYDCVIIPDFGAFVGNMQHARVDKYLKTYYPPTKNLTFNRLLKNNDGILANAIAVGENISYEEANNAINKFVEGCLAELETKKSLSFEDIGRLYLDKAEKLIFIAEYRSNFLIDSFGLHNIRYQKVEINMEDNFEKDKDESIINVMEEGEKTPDTAVIVEMQQNNEFIRAQRDESSINWKWLRIAALFFVILVGINLIIIDEVPDKVRLNKFSLFNLGVVESIVDEGPTDNLRSVNITNPNVTSNVTANATTDKKIDVSTETEKPTVTEAKPWESFEKITVLDGNNEKSGFYVIVGSFSQVKYANKAVLKYSSNYSAVKFTAPNGFTRVGLLLNTVDKENVEIELSDIRNAVNTSAWLVYNKNLSETSY